MIEHKKFSAVTCQMILNKGNSMCKGMICKKHEAKKYVRKGSWLYPIVKRGKNKRRKRKDG